MTPPTRALVCPGCQAFLKVRTTSASVKCPKCGSAIPVPTEPPAVTPAAPMAAGPAPVAPVPVTAPVPADPPGPPPRPWLVRHAGLALFAVGLGVGVLVAAGLDTLKPQLGVVGLILVAVGLSLPVALIAGIRAIVGAVVQPTADGPPTRGSIIRRIVGGFALLLAGGLLPCWAVAVGEVFGPEQGFARRLADKLEGQDEPPVVAIAPETIPTAPATDAPKPEFDPKPWGKADFALANPTHRLVGIRNVGTRELPEYRVVAKADDDEVAAALVYAWKNKLPVVASDPALARRVYESYPLGAPLSGQEAQQMNVMSRPRTYVPASRTLAAFTDPRGNKRLGHIVARRSDAFDFCDLVPRSRPGAFRRTFDDPSELPFETETLPASVLKSGSFRDLTPTAARSETDFLVFCVYSMLDKLQASESTNYAGIPVRPCLYVDEMGASTIGLRATLNELLQRKEAVFDRLREHADRLSRDNTAPGTSSMKEVHGLGAIIVDAIAEHIKATTQRRDRLSDLAPERKALNAELEAMRQHTEKLQQMLQVGKDAPGECRRLLLQAGVGLVTRDEATRRFYGDLRSGKKWLGVQSQSLADDAVHDGLVEATHLLLTEVDEPREDGTYHLSMRLVELRTGEILWEELGDRRGVPLPKRLHDIRGAWVQKRNDGPAARFAISESNGVIKLGVTSHPMYAGLELVASRNGNDINVTSCSVVYHESITRPRGKPPLADVGERFPVRAELSIVDANRLSFGIEQVYRDVKPVVVRGKVTVGPRTERRVYSVVNLERE